MIAFFISVSFIGLLAMLLDAIFEKRDVLIASYLDKKRSTEPTDAQAAGT